MPEPLDTASARRPDTLVVLGEPTRKRTAALPPRRAVSAVEGAAIGIALWCALFTLQVLPGDLTDTPGLLLLGGAGLAAGLLRWHRVLVWALVPVAAVVAIVSLSSLSELIAAHWVRDDGIPPSGVSAVVVLSASLNPDSTISSEALDHLITGLELVRGGRAPLLVTTETRERFPTGSISGALDQQRIVKLFDSTAQWFMVPGGRSTRDEAVASAALLQPRGIRRIAVVASPMHTRRACAVFAEVGFDVTCIAARMRNSEGRPLSPDPTDRLATFGQFVYELAATVEYRMRGWLAVPSPHD